MCTEGTLHYTRCHHQIQTLEPCKFETMHLWCKGATQKPDSKVGQHCPECAAIFGTDIRARRYIENPLPLFKLEDSKLTSLFSRLLRRRSTGQQPAAAASEAKAAEKGQARKKKEKRRSEVGPSQDLDLYLPFPLLDENSFNMMLGPFNPLHDDDDYEALQRWKQARAAKEKENPEKLG